MRDRLMSNYTVKPALARLKRTLLGLGGALAASMVVLSVLPPPPVNASYEYAGAARSYSAAAVPAAATPSSSSYDEEAVAKYEPWAEDEGEEGEEGTAPAGFDMRSHMMQQ